MPKDKKILVIGYFGQSNNQLDGQTLRTRSIYSLLDKYSTYQVNYFDTQSIRYSKLNLIKLIKLWFNSDIIFNIAAHRNLKILFPCLYLLSKLTNKNFNIVSVGGWLPDFLKNKPLHKFILKKINGVFVQTQNIYSELKKDKFKNIHLLNNFRVIEYPDLKLENKKKDIIRLVYMARVHPQKGVDLIFEIEKHFKKEKLNNIKIDIYGPILKTYEKTFLSKLKNSSINYAGILNPSDIHNVLQNYDLMLFPTKYYTEGFPGSILDAYISGIPVIASKWLNATEFIDDNKTGIIVDFNNDELFIKKLSFILKNPHKILEMKEHVKIKRNQYSSDQAWNTLRIALLK